MSEILKNAIIANYKAVEKIKRENPEKFYGADFEKYVCKEIDYSTMYDKYISNKELFF